MILLFSVLLLTPALSKTELLLQLSRHGAKNPRMTFPGHPIEFGFEKLNDLTRTGMRQHFNLGGILREKYPDLIPNSYDYYKMNFTVSDTNRTHSSALSQIQGMYYKGAAMKVDTPGTRKNWLPPFENNDLVPDYKDDDSALPDGFNFAPIESFKDEYNFMFRADKVCSNVKKAVERSGEFYNKQLSELFKPSYELFDKLGFNIGKMTANKVKSWDFYNLSDVSSYLTAWSYRDADKDAVKNSIPYKLRAHMIFINSVSNYADHSHKGLNNVYLTKLLESWKGVLEHFRDNWGNDEFITRVGAYVGHSGNLTSLALTLVDPDMLEKIINKYKEFLKRVEIENKAQFDEFLSWITKMDELVDMRFGSSFVLELNSSVSEEESSLYLELTIRLLICLKKLRVVVI